MVLPAAPGARPAGRFAALRRGVVAAGLALLAVLSALPAPAAAETRELDGETLALTHFVDAPVTISADASLHHRVRLTANALDCLGVTATGPLVAVETARCGDLDGGLRIEIGTDMPVTVTQNGDGEITIGTLTAPLVLTTTASGDIKAGNAGAVVITTHGSSDLSFGDINGPLKAALAGSGDLCVRALHGPLMLQMRGSGDVAVGSIEAGAADVDGAGSGDVLLGKGQIGELRVRVAGSGDFAFAGETRDADLTAMGGSDIKLGKVTGSVRRSTAGGSDILIGGPAVVDATIGKIAAAIGNGGGKEDTTVTFNPDLRHLLEVVAFGVIVFMVWRTARRGGLRRPSASMPGAAVTAHPGVMAVTETLKRVEARLGRVEVYVTSREFDLHQKFKQL